MSYTILKSTAEKLISEVKLNLKLVFPQFSDIFENTPIQLISGRDILTQTNRIAIEIGAPQVRKLDDTAAITLVGKYKFAIAVYYRRIPEYLFKHFLFHEFGHIISIADNREIYDEIQKDTAQDIHTSVRSGGAMWSEMIAEVFAYRIEKNSFAPYKGYALYKIEEKIDSAVNNGYFSVYDMAFYLAMFFEDPEVISYLYNFPNAALGTNNCDDDIIPILESILKTVDSIIGKDEFWKITKNAITELGEEVDALWDYCANKLNATLLDRMIDYLNINDQPNLIE